MARPPLPLNSAGSISISEVRPKVWRARCRYRDSTGVVSSIERSGSSRTAAQRALIEAVNTRRAVSVDTLKAHHRVSVAMDLFLTRLDQRLAQGDVAPTSADRYRYGVGLLRPVLGELRIGELNVGRIEAAFERLAERGLAANTRRAARGVLSQVLSIAVRHGALPGNLVREMSPITDNRRRNGGSGPRALTAEQRRQLFAWLDGDGTDAQRLARQRGMHDLILLMIGTGVRLGEALALTWGSVDLDGAPFETGGGGVVLMPSIRITGNVVRVRPVGKVVHPGKTAQSLRTVPIPRAVAEMLRTRRPADSDPSEPVFPANGKRGVGLTYREPTDVAHNIRDIRTELGWPWLTSHVFRKTAATILHDAGVSERGIGDHIGHTDRATLMNVYIGAGGEVDPRLLNAMDAALADT